MCRPQPWLSMGSDSLWSTNLNALAPIGESTWGSLTWRRRPPPPPPLPRPPCSTDTVALSPTESRSLHCSAKSLTAPGNHLGRRDTRGVKDLHLLLTYAKLKCPYQCTVPPFQCSPIPLRVPPALPLSCSSGVLDLTWFGKQSYFYYCVVCSDLMNIHLECKYC